MKEGATCSINDANQQTCISCHLYILFTAIFSFILGICFGESLGLIPTWESLEIPLLSLSTCWEYFRCIIRLRPERWQISLPFSWFRREEAEDEEETNGDTFDATDDPYESKRKDWKVRQRGTSFAKSIRKFSLLHDNRVSHGLIEAMGAELEIVSIDPTMRRLLGWPTEAMEPGATSSNSSVPLPTTVHDLLPEDFRSIHRQFLAKAIADGALPSSLMHPLRNVKMLRLDGNTIRANVCIGLITKDIPISSKECMFYALVSEREDAPPLPEKTAAQIESGIQDREDSIASITEARRP